MDSQQHSELLTAAKKTVNARLRIRFLSVAYVLEGHSRYQASSVYRVSRRLVNEWVTAYLAQGISGLMPPEIENRGAQPKLSPEQQTQLADWIQQKSQSDEGGRLIG